MSDKAKKGDCYEAAGQLALEFIRGKKPKAELVHGVALNSLDYMRSNSQVETSGYLYRKQMFKEYLEDFKRETLEHGWPSFSPEEVIDDNVIINNNTH